MTNQCTIISQIITLLHVLTLSCHPQGTCSQYLAKLHIYFKCSCWYWNLKVQNKKRKCETILICITNNYCTFSNLIHTSFWQFLKRKKKLVHGSNLHLSFNRSLPTRQTDWIILDVTNVLTVIRLTAALSFFQNTALDRESNPHVILIRM